MTQQWTRRDLLKRSGLAGAAIVGGPVLLGACSKAEEGGEGTLDRLKKAGTVKVGFAKEAPYSFTEGSKFTGEAPEVARTIFKALGVDKIEPVGVKAFGDLITGLNSQQYDVIAAGMFITPERCGQILFSNPDYAAKNAFAVKQGNPKGIKRFEDLAKTGAKVAVLGGAVEEGYAKDAGVKKDKIQVFPKADAAYQGLIDGRVDAIALTTITLNYYKKTQFADKPVEVTEAFNPVVKGKPQTGSGGYGFRKNDQALVDKFNAELKKLQDSGKLLQIMQPFGFTALEVDEAKKQTAAQLCKG
ncbi:ectoine/hydroxyectoine ABC transporter substrate-binding protein EhuB [Spirillospora sp. CA-294931]|uniref:ectoine/hydroxyectoine ABC transporter substrate-binding protein EhuB n=1 Tax=Spirillospora sp. CA-294931 TaxID=3240042 RepID=UPI003D8A379B